MVATDILDGEGLSMAFLESLASLLGLRGPPLRSPFPPLVRADPPVVVASPISPSWLAGLVGRGIEIGAHGHPIAGIKPFYVDRFFEFAGSKCPADVIADGGLLPFRRRSLDYVASSHLLEHLADPVTALVEWHQLVKPGGLIYLVVPDRRFTFDRARDRTPVAHLIEDFERGTTACDGAHIDEYFDRVDLLTINPQLTADDVPRYREEQRALHHSVQRAGQPINIHFHVFEKEDLVELHSRLREHPRARLRSTIIDVQERYPPERGDGFLVVLRTDAA